MCVKGCVRMFVSKRDCGCSVLGLGSTGKGLGLALRVMVQGRV